MKKGRKSLTYTLCSRGRTKSISSLRELSHFKLLLPIPLNYRWAWLLTDLIHLMG